MSSADMPDAAGPHRLSKRNSHRKPPNAKAGLSESRARQKALCGWTIRKQLITSTPDHESGELAEW
ncbi:hypothetical protein [Sedimentitalea xiamensis]|nr:hypothetical protein [Sedimentitalea xiamensis]